MINQSGQWSVVSGQWSVVSRQPSAVSLFYSKAVRCTLATGPKLIANIALRIQMFDIVLMQSLMAHGSVCGTCVRTAVCPVETTAVAHGGNHGSRSWGRPPRPRCLPCSLAASPVPLLHRS
ncbi:MAG: hypothetical protein F6J90_02475 [Moorea sp. SIOASIH]|uniref:hypothetical protein n=1 Tax=Moorena sp. SIOASIH TaxID=2607817 RepID=UPI0013BC1FE6|nr:hypothetical protein [Moorena sp. SIOASIH]NEO35231.1 hypothetical protein [Moorena sp. SIOASIH]